MWRVSIIHNERPHKYIKLHSKARAPPGPPPAVAWWVYAAYLFISVVTSETAHHNTQAAGRCACALSTAVCGTYCTRLCDHPHLRIHQLAKVRSSIHSLDTTQPRALTNILPSLHYCRNQIKFIPPPPIWSPR